MPEGYQSWPDHRFYVDQAVVPFGFGLAYTKFQYKVSPLGLGAAGSISLAPVQAMLRATAEAGRTFPATDTVSAAAPLATFQVNVTNVGSMDADDVVLGFLKPPGAGTLGVPLQTLFGFERVHVAVGQTVSVFIYPTLLGFTQVGEDGLRFVLPGDYSFEFGAAETASVGMGFAKHTVTTTL
jgi:hypothetical protein